MKNIIFLLVILLFSCNSKKETKAENIEKQNIESLGKKLPILPGMQAQVDIVTGNKSVLDYLTKPIKALKENAFRER